MDNFLERCYNNIAQKTKFETVYTGYFVMTVLVVIYSLVAMAMGGFVLNDTFSSIILLFISIVFAISILKTLFNSAVNMKDCKTYTNIDFIGIESKYSVRTFFKSKEQKTYFFMATIFLIVLIVVGIVHSVFNIIDGVDVIGIYEYISSWLIIIVCVFGFGVLIKSLISSNFAKLK